MIAMESTGYSIYEQYEDPTEELIVKDANNVIQFLIQVLGFQPADIIIMGRSIGTGVSCQIAKRYDFCATVLISPFTSLANAAKFMFPMVGNLAEVVLPDNFNSLEVIKQVSAPLLFIHGKEDKIVPMQHSKELFGKRGLMSR